MDAQKSLTGVPFSTFDWRASTKTAFHKAVRFGEAPELLLIIGNRDSTTRSPNTYRWYWEFRVHNEFGVTVAVQVRETRNGFSARSRVPSDNDPNSAWLREALGIDATTFEAGSFPWSNEQTDPVDQDEESRSETAQSYDLYYNAPDEAWHWGKANIENPCVHSFWNGPGEIDQGIQLNVYAATKAACD